MKVSHYYKILFSLLLLCSNIYAQNDYIFELVTLKDRANFGDVHSIYEDPMGIIWVGIYGKGLAYYNGEEIIRYPLPEEEKFANNEDVFIGKGAFIYLNDGDGVRILNPISQEPPTKINLSKGYSDLGRLMSIEVITSGKDTFIWGALKLTQETKETKYHLLISKNGAPFKILTEMPITTTGVPKIKGLFNNIIYKSTQSFIEISPTGTIENTYAIPKEYIANTTTFNWNIDANGTIRIGGKCFDDERQSILYTCEILEKKYDSTVFTVRKSTPNKTTFTKGRDGQKFLRTLFVLDGTPHVFFIDSVDLTLLTNLDTKKQYNITTNNELRTGDLFRVFKSKSGIIWLGGSYGLSKIVPQPKAFKMLPPIARRSIIEDEDGLIYGSVNWEKRIELDGSATNVSSVFSYNPKTDEIKTLFSKHRGEGYWHQANYNEGVVYYGSSKMNLKTREIDSLPLIKEDLDNAYLSLLDKKNHLWKADWGAPFIVIYDIETGERIKKVTIPQLVSKPLDLNDWYQRPSDGTVWLGTYGQGIFVFSSDGVLLKHINRLASSEIKLRNNVVSSFYEDKNGTMWIGHGAGLSSISPDFSSIKHYTFNESQPESRLVYGILPEDNDQFLWISTSRGLFRFDSKIGLFQDFPLHSQMMNFEFNRTSYLKGSNGQMYFGTSEDKVPTVTFFPKDAIDYYNNIAIEKSEILISSFSKYDASLEKVVSQNRQLQAIEEITLQPGDRYFTLRFLVSDFRSPKNNYFSFFLENYDEDWSLVARGNNQVRYENLPPGNYTLKMRGALLAGNVSTNERSISVIVLPYWYQTIFAKTVFILLLLAIGFLVYRFNLKRQFYFQERVRLKEVGDLKTRLYTNITHEFRTPLTVILGMNDTIKGFEKERTLIKRNAKSLLGLVNQLLDLSKLDSGTLKMNIKQGDVIIYLQYLTESFYSMASDKKVHLSFQSEVKSLLMGYDEVKLQHIVYNLLTNAIKFTRPGGKVNFSIYTKNINQNSQLEIKIKDTGIGMSPQDLSRIFDRFYQVDSLGLEKRTNKTFGGTGIGLALTKELIDLMGGTITVESELSWGTTFSVCLPVVSTHKDIALKEKVKTIYSKNDYETPLSEMDTLTDHILSSKPSLLIIEDNSGVVAYITAILEESYTLQVAINGKEGIEMAVAQIPDIIITDVMMPEKNGYEVCYFLKNDQRTSHIPIIVLTAKAGVSSRIEGLETGADAYLSKPFEKEELMIQLQNLLKIRKTLQERYATQVLQIEETAKVEVSSADKESVFVQELKTYIETHIQDAQLTVQTLADFKNLSHIQLYRKLKALTNQTPSQFIRSIRLQKALHLLKHEDFNVSEVAYQTGFSDPNYFTRVFKQEFGKVPGNFKS